MDNTVLDHDVGDNNLGLVDVDSLVDDPDSNITATEGSQGSVGDLGAVQDRADDVVR